MLSRLSRLFHTFTFRLGLVYVGLFSLSVIILFAFITTFATNYLEDQITESVRARYAMLLDEYHQNGSAGLESRIKELMASDEEGSEIYLVINNKDEKLAGNLAEWPKYAREEGIFEKEGKWLRMNIEGTRQHPDSIEVKAVAVPISKWRSLLVGQTMQNMNKVKQTITQTFWASLLLTLLMAFAGAVIMTRSVISRLAVINRSAHTIMRGNLSARIPFNRGGDEFDELSSNLNQMLDKIETLLQSLSQFANNIAHDLRSPLTRIIARTEAGLRGMRETSAARRLLDKNVEEMHELIGTFNSILKISELEANTDFRTFEPCDLTWITSRLLDFYEPYAAEKHIKLASTLKGPLIIQGEKNLLTQAFANLLDNAIKFTPENGWVNVSVIAGEDETEIIIADSGPGIPKEFKDKVFEKFFRLESSRSARGNGLGLSLVAAIASIHGAELKLEDNAPGLKVRFIFPQPARSDYTAPQQKEA